MLLVLFVIFLTLLFLGLPVAYSMGIASVSVLFLMGTVPTILVPQRLFLAINSFPLMAVPFFILAGLLMNYGGLTRRIVNLSNALVGHFSGGLAHVNILASMLFAGVSGSASADASAIGSMLIPAMREDGYDAPFSVGVTASSATIGPIIPPSIVMVIYGSMTALSIGALFMGGIIPGVLIGLGLMLVVYFFSIRRKYKAGKRAPLTLVIRRIIETTPAIIAPVIILGGILTGIFTATEAGVVACVYAFTIGCAVYREIKFSDFKKIFVESAVMTSVVMFILATASIFGWLLAYLQFSKAIVRILLSISSNPHVIYFLIVMLLLIIGLFIEALAAIIIFVPVLIPVANHFGFDQIHFALVIIITMLIGTVTPPVGLQLYIACAIAKISVSKATVWPFIAVMVVVLLLIVYFPPLVTYIPGLFFK